VGAPETSDLSASAENLGDAVTPRDARTSSDSTSSKKKEPPSGRARPRAQAAAVPARRGKSNADAKMLGQSSSLVRDLEHLLAEPARPAGRSRPDPREWHDTLSSMRRRVRGTPRHREGGSAGRSVMWKRRRRISHHQPAPRLHELLVQLLGARVDGLKRVGNVRDRWAAPRREVVNHRESTDRSDTLFGLRSDARAELARSARRPTRHNRAPRLQRRLGVRSPSSARPNRRGLNRDSSILSTNILGTVMRA